VTTVYAAVILVCGGIPLLFLAMLRYARVTTARYETDAAKEH
jgi:hypothetical protein